MSKQSLAEAAARMQAQVRAKADALAQRANEAQMKRNQKIVKKSGK